jgi:hypothetical protein
MRILGVVASSSREVPNAPTIGTATDVGTGRAFNNGAATVTFTAPTWTGGLPITGYTVTSSPGGYTGTGSSSPITVAGLQSNTNYTFTVRATNAIGQSAASAASNSILATTVPQAPTIGTATDLGTGTSVSVAFTGNATGGKAVSTYTATSSPSSITGSSASSPITVSGLTAGTAYTFTVTATNANGTSTASAASNSVTPAVPTSFDSIASSVPSGTGTVTFSSIPQTYKSLQLRMYCRHTGAGQRNINLTLNNVTTASYSQHSVEGFSGTVWVSGVGVSNSNIQLVTYANPPTTAVVGAIIDLVDYTSTSKLKTIKSTTGVGDSANTLTGISSASSLFNSTAAISTITVTATSTTFNTGTVIALYGIRG